MTPRIRLSSVKLDGDLNALWDRLVGDTDATDDLASHFAEAEAEADAVTKTGDSAQVIANLHRLRAVAPLLAERPPKRQGREEWYTEQAKKLDRKGRTLRERLDALEAVLGVLADNPPVRLLRRHLGRVPKAAQNFAETGDPDKSPQKPPLTDEQKIEKWSKAADKSVKARVMSIGKLPEGAQPDAVAHLLDIVLGELEDAYPEQVVGWLAGRGDGAADSVAPVTSDRAKKTNARDLSRAEKKEVKRLLRRVVDLLEPGTYPTAQIADLWGDELVAVGFPRELASHQLTGTRLRSIDGAEKSLTGEKLWDVRLPPAWTRRAASLDRE